MRKAEVRMQKLERPAGASPASMTISQRKAVSADLPRLREVIEASVRGLQAGDYSPSQIEGALNSVYGVDSQLIAAETYFAAEIVESQGAPMVVACGGWRKGRT